MYALAGGCAGALEITIDYPTEYCKTVMQLYPEMNKKGFVGVVTNALKTTGFLTLYRGYSSLLFFTIPKNIIRFGTFTFLKQNVFTAKSSLNTMLCGLSAGAIEATLVVTPMETFKVRLIHDKFMPKPQYRNLFNGISTIFKKEGFFGCYKGFLATLLKQSSNQGVRFLVYEKTSAITHKLISWKFLADFLAGGFAGFCSVMVNNPVDVVKTNMQGLHADQFKGFLGCFAWIWRREGLMGFYKGVTPRLARVILDVSLTFSLWQLVVRGFLWAQGRLDTSKPVQRK